ncbi:RibD family protein [Leucobacter komagatae]|uniref:RibD family protein n=1 Tax=Leucobacter komagatae TaxID=55969 RepID=UPI003CCC55D9
MTTRPKITVKWAQTLDGRAAAADGSSQWITGPDARADVHRRRAAADAILVGTGTLIADDPSLTARDPEGALLVPASAQPVPVIIGARAIPAGAKVLHHPALGARFPHPIRCSGADLAADMEELGALGIRSVFVEGGPHIVSSLLRLGLVDELLVYVAPALLGGPRLAVGDLGIESMACIERLSFTRTEHLGPDILITATPVRTAPDQKETR